MYWGANQKAILVFSYSFAHRKTFDFLTRLKAFGYDNIIVVGAPRVKLVYSSSASPISSLYSAKPIIDTEQLCINLGFPYIECEHSDRNTIEQFALKYSADTALISGARIISQSIISLFKFGVINFHPGELPATSGLDSFFWMIEKMSQPGVSVHFIDKRVDAGELIFFQPTSLTPSTSATELQESIYQTQLLALDRLLQFKDAWYCDTTTIVRPNKNEPMSSQQKQLAFEKLEIWKNTVIK